MSDGNENRLLNRRVFLRAVGSGLAAGCVAPALPAADAAGGPKRPPDVLFLILEDVSPSRFGCYGNTICNTPNIDRLAAGGVRFDNAHTTPPCMPSRTALMSGIRPETAHVYDNIGTKPVLKWMAEVPPLPVSFKQHGYHTVHIGKIGHPDDKTWWDEWGKNPYRSPAIPGRGPGVDDPKAARGFAFEYGPSGLDDLEDTEGVMATQAIEALGNAGDKPLFLAVGFSADHLPFRAPKKYFDMYPPEKMPISKNPGSGPDLMPTEETWAKLRAGDTYGVIGPNNPHTLEQWREAIAAHYACLTYADAQIGRILDALEKSGRARNTIVVLWSDHGFELGEDWAWRKGGLRDMSTKCALIVKAPGVTPPDGVCRRPVECMDMHSTLLDLCGIPIPKRLEAISMRPLLEKPDAPWKKAALIHKSDTRVGVSTERYRLNTGGKEEELFDHETDALEFHNVAGDARYSDVLTELRALAKGGWKVCLPK